LCGAANAGTNPIENGVDLSRTKGIAMKNSGTNTPNRIFKDIHSIRFVESQDPEMFELVKRIVGQETLPPKPIVRQILLQGLRKRAAAGEKSVKGENGGGDGN
jgi:hypothetical protein